MAAPETPAPQPGTPPFRPPPSGAGQLDAEPVEVEPRASAAHPPPEDRRALRSGREDRRGREARVVCDGIGPDVTKRWVQVTVGGWRQWPSPRKAPRHARAGLRYLRHRPMVPKIGSIARRWAS